MEYTTINGDNGTYLNIDMWYDNEFVAKQYGADVFFNDLSAEYWGWIYDAAGKRIGSFDSDDSVLIEKNFLTDFDIEASTKITATTDVCASSAGTPVNKIIYRKPDETCYGYANSGKKIEMDFWDWTCMEIILQNYIDSGLSRDAAINQFWADVKAYDPEEFDLILEYSRWDDFDDCVADGEYNELCVDYFMSLGFIEEPSEEDPNADIQACNDVKATTNLSSSTKYMANMVSASSEDADYKYYVAGYRDNLMRSLYDSLSTDSFDAVLDFANDLAHDDCFIQIKNLQTGSEVFYDASAWYNDVPEDVFEVTM